MTDSITKSIAGQEALFPACQETAAVEAFTAPHLRITSDYADVLGVRVSAIDMNLAVRMADEWVANGQPGYACVTGVHGVMVAQNDPEFLRILNDAAFNTPDGMPLSWVGWLQGREQMDRVYGPDFMDSICQLSVERGYRNFFYGGNPGVAELLSESLQKKYPGLHVVGTFTPPFRALNREEEKELLDLVHKSQPHILWVGLGTPKQERFMAQYFRQLEVPLLVGVGAAFDFHTGRLRECPDWIKRAGLQWVHRLIQEPARLWKRYIWNNSAFIWHIAWQLSGLRRHTREPS